VEEHILKEPYKRYSNSTQLQYPRVSYRNIKNATEPEFASTVIFVTKSLNKHSYPNTINSKGSMIAWLILFERVFHTNSMGDAGNADAGELRAIATHQSLTVHSSSGERSFIFG